MHHVEFRMIPLFPIGSESPVIIGLDCWRATLVFKGPTGPTFTLDGVQFGFLQAEDGNDVNGTQRIVFGGAYYDGKPIKIKHDFEFSFPPGSTNYALLVLEYIVHDGQ